MIVNPPAVQLGIEPHANMDNSYSGELVKEFQKTRQKLQEALAIRDKEREELQKQLYSENNKYMEDWWVDIVKLDLKLPFMALKS